MTRDEVIAISNAAADAAGIPRLLLLACGVAESNLKPDARRPSDMRQDAAFWPDVSGGVWQQTIRYDPDYRGGQAYPGVEETERVLALQYDVERSAKVAADNLKGKYNAAEDDAIFKALCRYNWPAGNGRPFSKAHESNYRRGITEATSLLGDSPMPTAIKLSEVLARGRSRIGDPYVWDGERPGGFDCSGFIRYCYDGRLTSFTDAILGETQRVEKPAPGDIVLYEYKDSSQPGVRFPHVGLFLSDTVTLDARFGAGVGEHPQLSRNSATRYYRRLAGVIVDTVDTPTPPIPPPPSPAVWTVPDGVFAGMTGPQLQERAEGLQHALAYVCDNVVTDQNTAQSKEAQRVRVEQIGARP